MLVSCFSDLSPRGPDLSYTDFHTSVGFVVTRIMHFVSDGDTSRVSEVCQSFSSFTSVILPPQSLTLKLSLLQSPSLPMSSSCEAILACFRYRKTIWPYFSKYPVFLQLRSNHRMNTPHQTPEFTVLLSNSPHLFSATSVHR